MAFIREIKKGSSVYLVKVASVREDGKVKQRVLEYIGKKESEQQNMEVSPVKRYADIKVLVELARELKLPSLPGRHHKCLFWPLSLPICCAKGAF